MRRSRQTTAALWRISLHEASHLITARALNTWNCECVARVDPSAGLGVCTLPAGLSAFADAAVCAAGTRGEKLTRVFPPPRRKPLSPLPPPDTAAGIRARATRAAESEIMKRSRRNAADDDSRIAAFCASLNPSDPRDWMRVFRRVHALARLTAWQNRAEIRRVAEILFHEGIYQHTGDHAHEEYFRTLRNENTDKTSAQTQEKTE